MLRHLPTLLAVIAIGLLSAAVPAAAGELRPCMELEATGTECAVIEAPLDRHGELAGSVRLQVQKKAATEGPRRGTLLFLAGGPGQSSTPFLQMLPDLFSGAARYDMLTIDQRGTGFSEMLRCERLERLRDDAINPKYHRAVSACANDLGAVRSTYNTEQAVEDIEQVRATLGIEHLTLFGVSYGTKLALAYAQKYPGRVAAILLDSVLPVDKPDNFELDGAKAIRRTLAAVCRASAQCRRDVKDPVGELTSVARDLAKQPLRGFAISPEGLPSRRQMKATNLFETLLAADLNLFVYEQLFGAISNARRGDTMPLLRLMPPTEDVNRFKRRALDEALIEFSAMLNLANTCEDAVQPWPRGTAVNAREPFVQAAADAIPASAFLPFDRDVYVYESLSSYCLGWPDAPRPSLPSSAPLPDVPTLAINGDVDIRTPSEGAAAAIASNPKAQLVTLPFTGHSAIQSDFSNCALTLAKRFLITGTTRGKCSKMPVPIDVRPAPPLDISEVRALSGRCTGGRNCRVARRLAGTVYVTMRDVLEQFAAGFDVRGGGLRGGTWEALEGFDDETVSEPLAIKLSAVEFVPGQSVSGTLDLTDFPRVKGVLRVDGDASIRFRLTGTAAYERSRDRLRLTGKGSGVRVSALTPKAARASARATRPPANWLRRPAIGWYVRGQSGWAAGAPRQAPLRRAQARKLIKR